MSKRNSGEGGFFHDVKRGIWIYQLRYTDADGNRGRKKFAAKTKREAMQKGKDFIDSLNRAADDGEKLTVGNWIRNWLENYAKPNVRPRTYEKYSSTLKAYILPTFENVLLNELTAADLQKHLNRLLGVVGKLKVNNDISKKNKVEKTARRDYVVSKGQLQKCVSP